MGFEPYQLVNQCKVLASYGFAFSTLKMEIIITFY